MIMKDKTFIKLLAAILIAGSILTIGHMVYAAYAYKQSSVIYFVSKEYWP